MTLYVNLFPDMSRKQYDGNDTFVFAAPIHPETWTAMQYVARRTPDRVGYLLKEDLAGSPAVIILRTQVMSDADCLTAAAYVRMVHNATERIYAVPGRQVGASTLINMVAGAPRDLCHLLDFDPKQQEGEVAHSG